MHDSPGMQKNGSSRRSGITSYIVVTHQHSTIRRAVDRLIFLHEVHSPRSPSLHPWEPCFILLHKHIIIICDCPEYTFAGQQAQEIPADTVECASQRRRSVV
jgi:hypothetical protein